MIQQTPRLQITPPNHTSKSHLQITPPNHTSKSHLQITPASPFDPASAPSAFPLEPLHWSSPLSAFPLSSFPPSLSLYQCHARNIQVAVYKNGNMAIVGACAGLPATALALTHAELVDAGCPRPELLAAYESKLSADEAFESGNLQLASRFYTSAIGGAPAEILSEAEREAAEAIAESYAPPKLRGLPPSRAASLMVKDRERTMPGRVRWLHGAFVGRSRANLGIGKIEEALEDARRAVLLCPLALPGWEQLAAVAEASGDQRVLSEADAQLRRLQPVGAPPLVVEAPPVDREAAQAAAAESRIKAGAAYAVAVGGILLAIFKKQVLEGQ